jgi:hypothetical protein
VPENDGRRRVIAHAQYAFHNNAHSIRSGDAPAPEGPGCVASAGRSDSGHCAQAICGSRRKFARAEPRVAQTGSISEQQSEQPAKRVGLARGGYVYRHPRGVARRSVFENTELDEHSVGRQADSVRCQTGYSGRSGTD